MKTAVSLPDPLFSQAERYARRHKRSRSELYATALADYLARHDEDAVTQALDVVLAELSTTDADADVRAVAASNLSTMLRHTPW